MHLFRHFRYTAALLLTAAGLLLATLPSTALAAADAQQVFQRYKDAVLQIRIVDTRSGNRISLGTGFVVDAEGRMVSNFHVVSEYAYHPEWNRIEAVSSGGAVIPLKLLAFDVVHDLSLLQAGSRMPQALTLASEPPAKGTPLYAFGIPLDLELTIVQGLYNGLLEKKLREQVHFTGAINPGMSGGPAVDENGHVVGVNVATAGNGVGFLVPVKYVAALLQQRNTAALTQSAPMLTLMRNQLLAEQQRIMADLLARPIITGEVGNYRTPKDWSEHFKCWGGDVHAEDKLYTVVSISCDMQSDIFLSGKHRTGTLSYSRSFVQAKPGLNDWQFDRLYGTLFNQDPDMPDAGKDDVGNFSCRSGFVKQADGLPLKTLFCLRAYRKLTGLYDMVLQSATLDGKRSGLINRLVAGGVSYDDALRISKKYLEALTWNKR
ncbi:Trypsin-like peptidase domain-containing protein [Andreprevotia lacus DSM 23236]|uniref:Trypsin-like peptidase domain-containing protein n=1 Tax=Andreprevotia lacus DSM 23236 TaxID=1121001 RepID=A0A1W1Y045_9NEIS|nr:serine protease [Andreprevotia lacus]SMC29161.1 Trypsin-like peptidase domain-containing protein [Andreprevotia lacus DSM 23236]